jgi:hypothetical protein
MGVTVEAVVFPVAVGVVVLLGVGRAGVTVTVLLDVAAAVLSGEGCGVNVAA